MEHIHLLVSTFDTSNVAVAHTSGQGGSNGSRGLSSSEPPSL